MELAQRKGLDSVERNGAAERQATAETCLYNCEVMFFATNCYNTVYMKISPAVY